MNAKYLVSFTAYENAASILPRSDGNVEEVVVACWANGFNPPLASLLGGYLY